MIFYKSTSSSDTESEELYYVDNYYDDESENFDDDFFDFLEKILLKFSINFKYTMPVKNLTTQKLIYSYMPSIDARPSKELRHWYTLLPDEEAKFTKKLKNNFVNFWVGTDYPWEYFHFQCTPNLEKMWYGPLDISHNILIKDILDDVPEVYNNHIKLEIGYGAVTSFENHKKEPPVLNEYRLQKAENLLTVFVFVVVMCTIVLLYIHFLL